MTKEHILEMYNDENIKSIYAFMYGNAFQDVYGIDGEYLELVDILEIPKEKLQLTIGKDGFYYVWGEPGPDFNLYKFEDYWKTWVFATKPLKGAIIE